MAVFDIWIDSKREIRASLEVTDLGCDLLIKMESPEGTIEISKKFDNLEEFQGWLTRSCWATCHVFTGVNPKAPSAGKIFPEIGRLLSRARQQAAEAASPMPVILNLPGTAGGSIALVTA